MIFGMIKYHWLVLLREPMNMFFGFGLPILQLFMASQTMEYELHHYILELMMPLFIVIGAMVLCFMDSGLSHAYSRQIKFLRRLRMTPVKPITYIFTGIMSRLAVLFTFAAIFITVSVTIFDVEIGSRNWAIFIGALVLVFIMFYLMGMFFANMLKNAKNSQSALYIVFFGFLLLLNGFILADNMPRVVRTILQHSPTVYAANVLQSAWMGDFRTGFGFIIFDDISLLIVLGLTAVFGLLSVKFFKYE